jgi:hypothetical protein
MNNKFGMMRKEVAMAYFEVLSQYLEGLKKSYHKTS